MESVPGVTHAPKKGEGKHNEGTVELGFLTPDHSKAEHVASQF